MLIVYKIWPKSTNQFTLEDTASPPPKMLKKLSKCATSKFSRPPEFYGWGGVGGGLSKVSHWLRWKYFLQKCLTLSEMPIFVVTELFHGFHKTI